MVSVNAERQRGDCRDRRLEVRTPCIRSASVSASEAQSNRDCASEVCLIRGLRIKSSLSNVALRGRQARSRLWRMKKVRDHYFHKAKKEGLAARSAFKIEEIDRKHRLFKPGMTVLDLGCRPGSWLQVHIETGREKRPGRRAGHPPGDDRASAQLPGLLSWTRPSRTWPFWASLPSASTRSSRTWRRTRRASSSSTRCAR